MYSKSLHYPGEHGIVPLITVFVTHREHTADFLKLIIPLDFLMQIELDPKQLHTCLEGQAGVSTVYAPEGFANKLYDAVNLGLDVFEADVRERIAVLVNIHST